MLCPGCGHENEPSHRFCLNCGQQLLPPTCTQCGKSLPPKARFCSECGKPVGEVDVTAAPTETPTEPIASDENPPTVEVAETREFLGKLFIFQSLKPEVLESLAKRMRLVSLPEGPIFKEKDATDALYIIKSGAAKVTKSAEAGGTEAVLAILSQGDSFGEIGLIDGLPRSADVTAMNPVECYILERDDYLAVLEQHPEMARSMLEALASMVRNADAWLARTI